MAGGAGGPQETRAGHWDSPAKRTEAGLGSHGIRVLRIKERVPQINRV